MNFTKSILWTFDSVLQKTFIAIFSCLKGTKFNLSLQFFGYVVLRCAPRSNKIHLFTVLFQFKIKIFASAVCNQMLFNKFPEHFGAAIICCPATGTWAFWDKLGSPVFVTGVFGIIGCCYYFQEEIFLNPFDKSLCYDVCYNFYIGNYSYSSSIYVLDSNKDSFEIYIAYKFLDLLLQYIIYLMNWYYLHKINNSI